MNKLTDEFIASYTGRQAPWGFGGLGEVVYLRTYSRKTETSQESWVETLRRVIDGAVDIGADLTEKEMETLFDHMFNLRCTVSGRALWQLGTPLVKKFNAASMNNCYYTNIEKIEDFEMVFDYLMLGGGVGFSVERAKIHELPKVKVYQSPTSALMTPTSLSQIADKVGAGFYTARLNHFLKPDAASHTQPFSFANMEHNSKLSEAQHQGPVRSLKVSQTFLR